MGWIVIKFVTKIVKINSAIKTVYAKLDVLMTYSGELTAKNSVLYNA